MAVRSAHESSDVHVAVQMAYTGNRPLDSLSAKDSQALNWSVEQRHAPQPRGAPRIHKHRITTQYGTFSLRGGSQFSGPEEGEVLASGDRDKLERGLEWQGGART